jgi:hypothetical protein
MRHRALKSLKEADALSLLVKRALKRALRTYETQALKELKEADALSLLVKRASKRASKSALKPEP